jgi:hypothetical protein
MNVGDLRGLVGKDRQLPADVEQDAGELRAPPFASARTMVAAIHSACARSRNAVRICLADVSVERLYATLETWMTSRGDLED